MIHLTSPAWAIDGTCTQTDPDVWYPEQGGSGQYEAARRICHDCRVLTLCLEYALDIEGDDSRHLRHGMFGGLTPTERADLATDRRKAERGAA